MYTRYGRAVTKRDRCPRLRVARPVFSTVQEPRRTTGGDFCRPNSCDFRQISQQLTLSVSRGRWPANVFRKLQRKPETATRRSSLRLSRKPTVPDAFVPIGRLFSSGRVSGGAHACVCAWLFIFFFFLVLLNNINATFFFVNVCYFFAFQCFDVSPIKMYEYYDYCYCIGTDCSLRYVKMTAIVEIFFHRSEPVREPPITCNTCHYSAKDSRTVGCVYKIYLK